MLRRIVQRHASTPESESEPESVSESESEPIAISESESKPIAISESNAVSEPVPKPTEQWVQLYIGLWSGC